MKRRWGILAAFAAAVTTGYVVRGFVKEKRPEFAPAVQLGARPMTEWYYADGRINPDTVPARQADGIRSPAREWIVVYNPGEFEASLELTFFFEQMPPRRRSWKVGGFRSESLPVQDIPGTVPPGMLYGVRIRSDVPVIVQPSRGEYEPFNPVTHAMASFIAYPGPLGSRETRWAYADGLVLASQEPLEEREWVSILNPSAGRPAQVRLVFQCRDQRQSHELTVPAERVGSVDLFQLPAFRKNSLAAVVVESDTPVVVEQVRRAYQRGVPVIASLWSCLAYPVGPEKRR